MMDKPTGVKEVAESFYPVAEVYPVLLGFKEHTERLRQELEQVISENWMPWPEKNLYDEGEQWDIFPFYGFGRELPANCERCPLTYALIKQLEGLRTAAFSRLGPKTALKCHYGPGELANQVLRSHFGLIVPEHCGIWVEGEAHEQRYGEWIVFDDSKLHSGFNYSDEQRIVILLDIERPSGIPKGFAAESPSSDPGGLPDNWGQITDYLKRDY